MYEKGYDNFYLVVSSDNATTQLYSGKYVFYEDLSFVKEETTVTGTTGQTTTEVTTDQSTTNTETVDEPSYKKELVAKQNNPFNPDNMPAYTQNTATDKNYFNVIIYVRFQTNMDKLDAWLAKENITPKIKYANMYFLERVYVTKVQEIKKLDYVEQVYDLKISLGSAPKEVKKTNTVSQTEGRALKVYKTPPVKKSTPVKKKYTPPKPNIVLENVVKSKYVKDELDNNFSVTSAKIDSSVPKVGKGGGKFNIQK